MTPTDPPTRSDSHLLPKRTQRWETDHPIPNVDVKRLMSQYVELTAARARDPFNSTARTMGKVFSTYFVELKLPISRRSLIQFAGMVEKKYAKEYAKNLVRFACSFCRWLFAHNLLDAEIWTGITVRVPFEVRTAPEINYPETMKLLRNRDPDLAFLFCLAYSTGMAVVDCCNLKWTSVDLDAGFLRIRRQKTGTPATIPIRTCHDLMLELSRRAEEHAAAGGSAEDYVLPAAAERYKYRYNVAKWLPRTMEAMGLPRLNWHDLRRAFVSRLVGSKVNLLVASKITGHAKIDLLRRYATVSENTLEEAMEMMQHEPKT